MDNRRQVMETKILTKGEFDCKRRCELSLKKKEDCSALLSIDESTRYRCTLPFGHKGPHIACGFAGHNYAGWEDVDSEFK